MTLQKTTNKTQCVAKKNKADACLHTSAQQTPLIKARCAIKRGFIKTPLHNFVTANYRSIEVR
jgi:hypothetical protein